MFLLCSIFFSLKREDNTIKQKRGTLQLRHSLFSKTWIHICFAVQLPFLPQPLQPKNPRGTFSNLTQVSGKRPPHPFHLSFL